MEEIATIYCHKDSGKAIIEECERNTEYGVKTCPSVKPEIVLHRGHGLIHKMEI